MYPGASWQPGARRRVLDAPTGRPLKARSPPSGSAVAVGGRARSSGEGQRSSGAFDAGADEVGVAVDVGVCVGVGATTGTERVGEAGDSGSPQSTV